MLIPDVSGIVAFIDVCGWRCRTTSKSHVATTYLCMHFCCNYIGWSNQAKYYEIEMHCAKQNVATWLYEKANIFLVQYFWLKTQADWLSRLATRVTMPDTHGIKSHICALIKKVRWNRTFILFYQEFTSSFFVQKIFFYFNFSKLSVHVPCVGSRLTYLRVQSK